MTELTLTRDQVQFLVDVAEEHSILYITETGPLLRVRIYVQSASSSGYTCVYFNKKGKRVDA